MSKVTGFRRNTQVPAQKPFPEGKSHFMKDDHHSHENRNPISRMRFLFWQKKFTDSKIPAFRGMVKLIVS